MDLKERFLKYIAIDTKSNENSSSFPSTNSQLEFGDLLVNDLHEIGLLNAYKDEFGYVYGRIDVNKDQTIGLIAHMDTATVFDGGLKEPLIINSYDGKDIYLKSGDVLSLNDFPFLKDLRGEDLICTDGYHLLGADDKAGIAIIFEIIKYFLLHKDELKVNLAICFTPDEEIGLGASKFDVKKMNANIAYTIDGGPINYANYENFNAASAKIIIHGINVHPGSAKDIMINASLLAIELNNLLPSEMIPSKTEEYEGFIHLEEINGDVNKASLSYILRDHDLDLLKNKKELILKAVDTIKNKYPKAQIEYEIKDSYLNMAPEIIHHPEALLTINNAYLKSNETISYLPIRGGTDGATITYMGLPCPNLGTGGYNAHGKFELVSLTQMNKMIEILKNMLN